MSYVILQARKEIVNWRACKGEDDSFLTWRLTPHHTDVVMQMFHVCQAGQMRDEDRFEQTGHHLLP